MRRLIGLWLLGAALLAPGCGGGAGRGIEIPISARPTPDDMTITATGEAAGTDPAAARQAERRAVRSAVEKALDRILASELTGVPRRVAHARILGAAGLYVRTHRRLPRENEKKERGTSVEVKVKATVNTGMIRQELRRIRRSLEAERLPRVLVVIGAARDGEAGELAQRAIEAALVRRRFRIVERAPASVRRDVDEAFGRDDAKAISEAARSAGAEVVIAGRSSASSDSARASVKLRAVDTRSERDIHSGERTASGMLEADALSSIATALAGECIEAMRGRWGAKGRGLRTVIVRVKGLGFADFVRLVRMAASLRGVAASRALPFSEARAEFEVEHAGDPLDLAESFTALGDLPLRIVTAGVGRIELEAAR
jgi:hypothetical protein